MLTAKELKIIEQARNAVEAAKKALDLIKDSEPTQPRQRRNLKAGRKASMMEKYSKY